MSVNISIRRVFSFLEGVVQFQFWLLGRDRGLNPGPRGFEARGYTWGLEPYLTFHWLVGSGTSTGSWFGKTLLLTGAGGVGPCGDVPSGGMSWTGGRRKQTCLARFQLLLG